MNKSAKVFIVIRSTVGVLAIGAIITGGCLIEHGLGPALILTGLLLWREVTEPNNGPFE